MSAVKDLCTAAPGENRRLELELGARFEGSCGFALVLAPSQMREHGLGPFGRADLHPRRNPLDRQGRFAPQPNSAGQLAGVAAPASGPLGLLPAPARKLLRDEAVGPLLGGLAVQFPGVALAKLTLHQLQHLLFELLAAQVPAPPQRLERFLVDGLQRAPFHLPLELLTPPLRSPAQWRVPAAGSQHDAPVDGGELRVLRQTWWRGV